MSRLSLNGVLVPEAGAEAGAEGVAEGAAAEREFAAERGVAAVESSASGPRSVLDISARMERFKVEVERVEFKVLKSGFLFAWSSREEMIVT